jgi:integrase/recombinase XerD
MQGRRKGGRAAVPTTAPADPASLDGRIRAFLVNLEARAYSPSGVESHRWALKQFLAWAESRGLTRPEPFTRPLLEEYQLFLFHYRSPRTGKPLATNSQLARLGCIQRFFAWLCRSGVLLANPAADLDLPRKQARNLPKSLSEAEITRLLDLPDLTSPFGLRDRTILELFYATGIRRAEMANLDLGDFDPALQTLHIRRGKGGKDRVLPVGGRAAHWLNRYCAEVRPLFAHLPTETGLFLSGYATRLTKAYLGTWVSGLMRQAGITKPGSCHLFRHSCATHMLEGGADIRYIQAMLGHARLDTTQIYTHVSIRALQDVHARTHPHGRLTEHAHSPDLQGQAHSAPSPYPESLASFQPTPDPLPAQLPMTAVLVQPSPAAVRALESPQTPKPPGDDEPPSTKAASARTPPPIRPNGGNCLMESRLNDVEPPSKTGQLTYYGYRWFDPVSGRWASRDPLASQRPIDGDLMDWGFLIGGQFYRLAELFALAPYEKIIGPDLYVSFRNNSNTFIDADGQILPVIITGVFLGIMAKEAIEGLASLHDSHNKKRLQEIQREIQAEQIQRGLCSSAEASDQRASDALRDAALSAGKFAEKMPGKFADGAPPGIVDGNSKLEVGANIVDQVIRRVGSQK